MIGEDAFCPKTGAPLSKEADFDDRGRPRRTVLADERSLASQSAGELSNGAVRSSKSALFNRFRNCHTRHYEADDALYRKAALGLCRLKGVAEGNEAWDVHIWYALQRRLSEVDYDTEWMDVHVEPRCPRCHGRLKYERYDTGEVSAHCGTRCTGRKVDHLTEIRETIATLYSRAFDDTRTPEEFLQF